MKVTVCLLFLAILGFSSGFDSTTWFCDDQFKGDIHLDLSNVGIKTLRKSFVSSEWIKCLNLGYNQATGIEKDAFVGLSNLTALNLSGNSIEFQDFAHLYELPVLKTLVLDEAFGMMEQSEPAMQLTYDYDDYGQRTTTTRTPKYRFVSYEALNILVLFPQLEKLSMCNYRTDDIKNFLRTFDVPNLTHLRLNGNSLTGEDNLPRSITRNLTHLYLDDNEIKTFAGITLPNIRHLSMNNNKIRRLCAVYCNEYSMTPRAMLNLEHLSLVGNAMVAIDADAFTNSAKLTTLNLAENLIENFPRHTFDNMTNLQKLTLDDNHLDRIPDICALVNLQELSINGNRITSINQESFCNLTKLNFVSLRKNGLTSVAIGTFGNLPTLTRLDMSWNYILRLPENWMRSGIRLEELNLDANGFNDVASMSLGQFESLGYLSIGRNPLKTMTIGSLINLPVNTTLDLGRACESKDEAISTDDPLVIRDTPNYTY